MEAQTPIDQLEHMFPPLVTTKDSVEEFRTYFQRSLRKCVAKGFSVEESFGIVWEEPLETMPLSDSEYGKLYEQLIAWAKQLHR